MIGPLPHSPEAEKAILGAVLLDNRNLDKILSVGLKEENFYLEPHRMIFREMKELSEKGEFDSLILIESMKRKEILQKSGGAAYISSLTDGVFESMDLESYLGIVLEDSKRRRIVEESERAIEASTKKLLSAEEIVASVQEKLFEITEQRKEGFFKLTEAGQEALEYAERARTNQGAVIGIPTGLTDLDRKTTGFHPGELIVIAGRPGMGKTALALTLAYNAARDTKLKSKVGFFSLEMSKLQIGMRMLSMVSKIDMQRIREGTITREELGRLNKAQGTVSTLDIHIDASPSLTTTEILARARRLKKEEGLDLVIVDYLQLLTAPGVRDRVNEVGIISRTLKELAKRLSIPVIALSQLNREPERRTMGIPRPRLSDLRESGSIEQDADVVMLLYRDEYYDRGQEENKGIAELRLEKQRNGPTGEVLLAFEPSLSLFVDLAPESKNAYRSFMEMKGRRKRRVTRRSGIEI